MTTKNSHTRSRVYRVAVRTLAKDWQGFELQEYLARGRRCFYRRPDGVLVAIVLVDCFGWTYKAQLVDGTTVSWSRSERLRGAWMHQGPATRLSTSS